MKLELTTRRHGVHSTVDTAELPGDFSDYAVPAEPGNADRDEYVIDETTLLADLPEGFLPVRPRSVLLGVSDGSSGTAISGLSVFRPWGKYFDAHMVWLVKAEAEPLPDTGPSTLDMGMDAARAVMAEMDDEVIWLEGYDPADPLNRPIEMTSAGEHSWGGFCVKLVPTLDMISVRADTKSWGMGDYEQAELSPESDHFKPYIFVQFPSDPAAITGPEYAAELRAAIEKALAAIAAAQVPAR